MIQHQLRKKKRPILMLVFSTVSPKSWIIRAYKMCSNKMCSLKNLAKLKCVELVYIQYNVSDNQALL